MRLVSATRVDIARTDMEVADPCDFVDEWQRNFADDGVLRPLTALREAEGLLYEI